MAVAVEHGGRRRVPGPLRDLDWVRSRVQHMATAEWRRSWMRRPVSPAALVPGCQYRCQRLSSHGRLRARESEIGTYNHHRPDPFDPGPRSLRARRAPSEVSRTWPSTSASPRPSSTPSSCPNASEAGLTPCPYVWRHPRPRPTPVWSVPVPEGAAGATWTARPAQARVPSCRVSPRAVPV